MLFKLTGVIFFSLLITYLPAQVKIGDNPTVQDPSAVLELEKTNMGLLITRVSLTDVFDVTTIPSPANSLLVYNTNFGGGTDPVSPGFYYWREDQTRWIRLATGSGGTGGDVWIDGNNNILSVNSANQALGGEHNVILGYRAFADDNGSSGNVIAIGEGAAQHDQTVGDARNIAIGYQAAFNNTGYDVTFIGREAGMNNANDKVIGIGDYAGYLNTGGNVNALGTQAAYSNQQDNVNAFGFNAASNNQGGSVNAMGNNCAYHNTGSLVNAYGGAAGEFNTGWSVNVLGNQAGQHNTGNDVNAMGAMAADNNTTACVNAFGLQAARYNTGYGTNALGFQSALYNNGEHAVAIGDQALIGEELVFEGAGNIGMGFHAGSNVNTGFRNICLGYDTQIPNPFANDQINIGNTIIRESYGMIRLNDFIRLTPLAEPPADAEEGSVYYDSAMQKLRVLTGSGWEDLN